MLPPCARKTPSVTAVAVPPSLAARRLPFVGYADIFPRNAEEIGLKREAMFYPGWVRGVGAGLSGLRDGEPIPYEFCSS